MRVRSQREPEAVRIAVEDQGPGVSAADAPRVFDRFYRAAEAGTAPGSGLGLAIAQNLARLHGGDIALHTAPGQGSTFALSLPLAGAAP